jgi:hypothetical protein
MAPIVQPYSQDACGIGSGAFSALGWAESRFEIDFLVVIFSIVVVSIVVVSIICAAYFREDVVAELILMVNPLYRIMSVAMLNYEWYLALRSVIGTLGAWPK